jgi:hypothetical protein
MRPSQNSAELSQEGKLGYPPDGLDRAIKIPIVHFNVIAYHDSEGVIEPNLSVCRPMLRELDSLQD